MTLHVTTTQPGIYFITFTCFRWLPIIELVNGYDQVYKWFSCLERLGHIMNAYVIMPNHFHCLLYYDGGGQSLNQVIGNGKRFMAYEFVRRLKTNSHQHLLQKLSKGVNRSDAVRGKKHEIWEKGFDLKVCRTEDFALQKLSYLHNNPCSGKWRLATDILRYPHSSAAFYISGRQGLFPVKDYRDFLRIDE